MTAAMLILSVVALVAIKDLDKRTTAKREHMTIRPPLITVLCHGYGKKTLEANISDKTPSPFIAGSVGKKPSSITTHPPFFARTGGARLAGG
jgi:hypothetical protein